VLSWKGAAIQRLLEHGSGGTIIVESRYQETAGGDCNRLGTLVCMSSDLEIGDGAKIKCIKCNYESRVKVVNKSSLQSKPPSRVSLTRDSINIPSAETCRSYPLPLLSRLIEPCLKVDALSSDLSACASHTGALANCCQDLSWYFYECRTV
jgi:hypothetical protein